MPMCYAVERLIDVSTDLNINPHKYSLLIIWNMDEKNQARKLKC